MDAIPIPLTGTWLRPHRKTKGSGWAPSSHFITNVGNPIWSSVYVAMEMGIVRLRLAKAGEGSNERRPASETTTATTRENVPLLVNVVRMRMSQV